MPTLAPMRSASERRDTSETKIGIEVNLDGDGLTSCRTGIPFFDHMLDQLGRHGGFDLTVDADGDLDIDAHHTVEDTGILLGTVFARALGDKVGVRRFASSSIPLDEALVDGFRTMIERNQATQGARAEAVNVNTNNLAGGDAASQQV